jgi:hypothetical protein
VDVSQLETRGRIAMKNHALFAAAAVSAALFAGCSSNEPKLARDAGSSAEYTVTFTGTWTAESHPLEYPKAGIVTGPHFSGLIGTTHRAGYAIFKQGEMPSAGLERLAEEGKHSPLDEQIRSAIAAGDAGTLFESDPIRDPSKSVTTKLTADAMHPLVSAVAMIAPSPDWFAGVADVSLMESGKWVDSREVVLYAWDAGSDDGKTYEASDQDASPKKATMIQDTPHFTSGGKRVPVAKLTFKKM